MSAHIALLRAVNVGGQKQAIMAELRTLLTELGFSDVHSILQTGNLVFRGGARTGDDLEDFLEKETAKRLDLQTDFFVRPQEEWKRIIAHNPFPEEAKRDPAHLVVMFLKRAPSKQQVEALHAALRGPEMVSAKDRQAYIVYPNGIGRSPLTSTLLERKFGTRGTARNWNTILKLGSFISEGSRFAGPA
ncbi:MAG: DUF1697 domain-containing protein [Verrucomicrobia bacterium]|nr:DUF1697 domain-containing protein [Verrucomicrobiota bacterium]